MHPVVVTYAEAEEKFRQVRFTKHSIQNNGNQIEDNDTNRYLIDYAFKQIVIDYEYFSDIRRKQINPEFWKAVTK